MSWFTDFFKGKEGEMKTISTMDPTQKALLEKLGPYVTGKVGEGLPGWEGKFTAPLGPLEEKGLGKLGEYMGKGLPETTQFGLGKYQEALKGMEPEAVHDWYMKYIAPSEQRYLKETMIPEFKESMVPGGTLRSTGTERGIGEMISKFGEGQMGRVGEAIMGERAGAREMMGLLPGMAELETGLPLKQAEAGLTLGAIPRLLQQQELTSKIAEFVRTTPELSPILDMAMNMLQIQTKSAYYQQPEASPFMQLAEVGAKGLGSYLGAGGGFGGGGASTAGVNVPRA